MIFWVQSLKVRPRGVLRPIFKILLNFTGKLTLLLGVAQGVAQGWLRGWLTIRWCLFTGRMIYFTKFEFDS